MNLLAPTPLADDVRAVDHCLARWVEQRTGSALLARAVFAASRAEGQGHSCARLDDADADADARFDPEALSSLQAHPWVGDGSAFTPFVLDAQQRFYLWRTWQHEGVVAREIRQRCAQRTLPLSAAALCADLTTLFGDMPAEPTRWQRAAVAAAAGTRLFVLTGGPGTGKTTTVIRMLLMLLQHAKACGLPAEPSIALAAPTGKAAQRLVQAIAKGKKDLQSALPANSDMRGLLPAIPHADARTLHRLLGYRPAENRFDRSARQPLAEDIVLVDEASMVDLAMMRQLLDAVRPDALLILLGDPGQLASVDAGSVLSDIVASTPLNAVPQGLAERLAPCLGEPPASPPSASPLDGHVITLLHSWRAGSGLQRGIEAMRHAPDPVWLESLLADRRDGSLHLHHAEDSDDLRRHADRWIDAHATPLQALLTSPLEPGAALQLLPQRQILCALRDGPFGAQGINQLMARRLAHRFAVDANQPWYHGRPVIVTRNDYARGLFNGDVGLALKGADGLRVWFEIHDRDGQASLRSFSPRALPAHESAWAITIHRSQGSEYRDVAVVLPPDADNRILTRELVYTAISRAKDHAEIWSTDASLCAALNRPVTRMGGLRERLERP